MISPTFSATSNVLALASIAYLLSLRAVVYIELFIFKQASFYADGRDDLRVTLFNDHLVVNQTEGIDLILSAATLAQGQQAEHQ